MTIKRATVFGGSGFVGRLVVKRLAERGVVVRAAVRDPERANFLRPMGAVGQVVPVDGDVTDDAAVAAAVAGADVVINAVGYWKATRRRNFGHVHVEGAGRVAARAAAAGAGRLVLLSGIGVSENSRSEYVRARAFGETKTKEAFPGASVLRPSVLFGPGDRMFSLIAGFARYAPIYPLIGGETRMQPVYVGDVADAVLACLDDAEARGATFELGGPIVYAHRELVEMTLAWCSRVRPIVPLPFWAATLLAQLTGWFPGALLTRDQVELLRDDNVVGEGAPGFDALGIRPAAPEAIVPAYLDRFRRGGRWKHARLA